MKYIGLGKFGGPEVLEVCEEDPPVLSADEVLIKVIAAGVNRPDVIQRQGLYPAPAEASPVLGLEVSGEIIEKGDRVSSWQVGDMVCALTNGGGYAEQVAVPAAQCLPVPGGYSMVEAAALPETMFTVWSNIFDRAGLKAGESFLVHGGSSGIGTTAIQMVKAMGGRVFSTAGSNEKCEVCELLGAELAINYQEDDFVECLKKATDNKGIDVILDMVGGDYIARNIMLAAIDGRIVNIAYLQGPAAKVNFLPVMLKRLTLTGSTLRPRSARVKAGIARQLKAKIWPFCENGTIRPVIAQTFPLDKAAEAHRLMESNQHIGKIVLQVS